MSKKNLIFLIVLIVASLMLFACGGDDDSVVDESNGNGEVNDIDEEDPNEDLPVMTMEEVAENDGLDGRNAYVVVDGIVYDVTDSPRWPNGNHNGNQAGQDLTTEIMEDSPHGLRVLGNVEAIGRIE